MTDLPYFRRSSRGGLNRTTSSWTDHGGRHEVETTSYLSPGISFSTIEHDIRPPVRSFTSPAQLSARVVQPSFRSRDLGATFEMLERLVAGRHRKDSAFDEFSRPINSGRSSRTRYRDRAEPNSFAFDESSSGESVEDHRRAYSRQKELPRERSHRERRTHPDDVPSHRSRTHHRHRSSERDSPKLKSCLRSTERSPSRFDRDAAFESQRPEHASTTPSRRIVEAVEKVVESEQRSVRRCKQQLKLHLQQDATNSQLIQRLVDELKDHEESLKTATDELNKLKFGSNAGKSHSHSEQHSRSRQTHRSSHDDPAGHTPRFRSKSSSRHFHPSDPVFRAFREFDEQYFPDDPLAAAFDEFFNLGSKPLFGEKFTSFSGFPTGNTRSRGGEKHARGNGFRYVPNPFEHSGAPKSSPPATLLTPDEAKKLYEIYNQRWNALSSTDGNVPFPAREFLPASLTSKTSIWAPNVDADVSTWSAEDVMQANAQAFFLGAVGLKPRYSQSSKGGRLEMGFDRKLASPVQIKELTDILKKEKTRWHSDRLGRRNDNSGTTNEKLQKDERARAVFHAVCELMEIAQ